MDGKGWWIDNVYIERLWWTVKHEDVYLRRYETVTELSQGLARFFHWYNTGRIHSSLNYKTPWSVYYDETKDILPCMAVCFLQGLGFF
jgi:Transposase and inactivated derivatives